MKTIKFIAVCAAFMLATSSFSQQSGHHNHHQAAAETSVAMTRCIGERQAQIRDLHLQTHLKQSALLRSEQFASYASLRGYTK